MQARVAALVLGASAMATVGLWVGPAYDQGRHVSVNGQWLTPQQLAEADHTVGFLLPNGHYWYDAVSGYWGVVGGPVVGQVAPPVRGGNPYYHAGPGGYTGSDGQCSYYLDPQTGASVMTGNC